MIRLGAVADLMCSLSPLAFGEKDFASDLSKQQVSYSGQEVHKAEGLIFERVLPTLPPRGVAGTVDILPLVQGFTREALLNPDLVRLDENEVEADWAWPRIRMGGNQSAEALLVELHGRGLLREWSKRARFGNTAGTW